MKKYQSKLFLALRLLIYVSFFLSRLTHLSPQILLSTLVSFCLIYDIWDSYQNWRKLK